MFDLRLKIQDLISPFIIDYCNTSIQDLFTIPPKGSNAHIALPCFIFAKKAKLPPPEIAKILSEKIPRGNFIIDASAIGPYLNFQINTKILLKEFILSYNQNKAFLPKRDPKDPRPILIEYSQPNTHKLFHIGHIRNVAIGDSLCRILRYNNNNVISLNYIGDIGAHIAKFLWYFQKTKRTIADFEDGIQLGKFYVESSVYFDKLNDPEKEKARQEISKIQRSLENRSSEYLMDLWKITKEKSIKYFDQIYDFLNAEFNKYYFESEVEQEGIKLIKDYYEKGIFEISQNAIVAHLGGKLNTFLVLKSDGTSLYSTKDIALAYKKQRDYDPGKSYYIVGSEQVLYFKQLVETLKIMGFENYKDLKHISYELVSLQDEKMSSRYGNIVSFHDLRDAIYEKIKVNYIEKKDWKEEVKEDTIYKIALATIRYGMVSKGLNKKIVFNLEEWLKPEGDTGAYILYTIARINSIIKKAPESKCSPCFKDYIPQSIENEIIIFLSEFEYTLKTAQEKLDPSVLANYIFDLCKAFNRFYHQCPVMNTEEAVLNFRLNLITAIRAVLEKGVSLLGFYHVDQM